MGRSVTAVRAAGWDVVVAFFAGAAVFAAVFGLGRLSHPAVWFPETATVAAAAETEAPATDPTASLPTLEVLLQDLGGSGAVLEVSGAVTGRFVFPLVDRVGATPPFDFTPPDGSETLHVESSLTITYRGDDGQITIAANGVGAGISASEIVNPTIRVNDKTFFRSTGSCTVAMSRFEPMTDTNAALELAGEITCAGLTEVRTGEVLSFVGVFAYADV